MSYLSPKVSKPNHGDLCIVVTESGDVALAVWHRLMGQGGDFATMTKRKKTTSLDHLPGVVVWELFRGPTKEEVAAALGVSP